MKENLKTFAEQGKFMVVKNYFRSDFTWSDAIYYLNNASNEKSNFMDGFKKLGSEVKNLAVQRGFGFFQILLNNSERHPFIYNSLNSLYKEIEDDQYKPSAHQVFINLFDDGHQSGPHKDNWDVMYLELIGDVLWEAFDEAGNVIEMEVVSPGDAVIVPKGVIHNVAVLTPRVSLSTSFNYESEQEDPVMTEYIDNI